MSSILIVCLGNICRSPLAEGILRYKTKELKLNTIIDSAGTSDNHVGQHPDKRSILNAKKNGIDISQLKARQFKVSDFDIFDYIYVMDEYNYADVLALARDDTDKKKVDLILNKAFPNSNMAVPDPYYGGEKEFEQVFQLLNKACLIIAKSL
jgi:protein-tyrosine phosphatase